MSIGDPSRVVIHQGEYRGYLIEILPDEDTENPRNWDNLGTMVCAHRRYRLGDEQFDGNVIAYERQMFQRDGCIMSAWDIEWHSLWLYEHYVSLPLYLYDHSGLCMSTSPFSCPWDSGQVGKIYCSIKKAKQEYGIKRLSGKRRHELRDQVEKTLQSEVAVYSSYLAGEGCGYEISKIEESQPDLDASCWGYYDSDDCFAQAKAAVDAALARA